jgi:hypothetical protein
MSTYLGWNVILMPGNPPAPASFEMAQVDITGINTSPFTGQQQVQYWSATWQEGSVSLPPLQYATAQEWIAFLQNLQGMNNVFQFSAAFQAAYPLEFQSSGGSYFRLKSNIRKWSVSNQRVYGISFDFRTAF